VDRITVRNIYRDSRGWAVTIDNFFANFHSGPGNIGGITIENMDGNPPVQSVAQFNPGRWRFMEGSLFLSDLLTDPMNRASEDEDEDEDEPFGPGFIESPLFHLDLLTGHEPDRREHLKIWVGQR
jgi:hypothetical protein